MEKSITTIMMAAMSFVITISLISATTDVYAQQENKTMNMDKSHKYFVIQDTKISHPDNMAPEHQQYHQIAIVLPPQSNKIYVGQLSYSASNPVNVFVMQPLNTTITQNATAIPLANVEGGFAVSGSHILDPEVADNVDFAGSAVYFHSRSSEPFTVAYTAVGKTVEPTPLYK
jgi:hypothetical protein